MSDYDYVYLMPKEISTIRSRSDVSLKSDFLSLYPLIASPMKGITGYKLVIEMGRNNCLGILHRFDNKFENRVSNINKIADAHVPFGVAIGVNDFEQELRIATWAVNQGACLICVDIANGYLPQIAECGKILKDTFGDRVKLMTGNVVNALGAQYIKDSGFDFVRCSIGSGCFAAGTRILMANGTYKDIEKLMIDDEIIDGLGYATKVKGIKKTGIKKVMRYRHPLSYQWTYCTPEHLHRIYDMNKYSERTIASGIKLLANRTDVEWGFAFELNKRKYLTYPNKIYFNIPDTFNIDLNDYAIKESLLSEKSRNINPDYSLGYIFGTFLGDGCAGLGTYNKSETGGVSWTFGLKEMEIAQKVSSACENVLGKAPVISHESKSKQNTIVVKLHSQPFSRFLQSFGKRKEKHLPQKYMCSNKEYLQGIFDGLIDSDGHIEENGRLGLSNTSTVLLEQFGILCYLLYGSFPSVSLKNNRKDTSTLEGMVLENCSPAFLSRLGPSHDKKHADFFTVVEFLEKEMLDMEIPVYDIEVESEDHSFIANGIIVHNSLCTTRQVTGIGRNALAALSDCRNVDVELVIDGGIRQPGDVVKSFAMGADWAMLGSTLAYAKEAENKNGRLYGMASFINHKLNNKTVKSIEGRDAKINPREKKPLKEILDQYLWGIRSACTYLNAHSYKDIVHKAQIISTTIVEDL